MKYLLDKSQPIPSYYQVKESLLNKIKSNQYKVGDLIPSESELQETYKVSRITIRRAIQELVQEGHLYTQQGKGTFVSKPKTNDEINMITGWAETVAALGMRPESKVIGYSEEPAPDDIAGMLNIMSGEKVYKMERLRYADNEPLCFMTNYLVPDVVPGFMEIGPQYESLYEMLEKQYNVILGRAEEIIVAKAATSLEADLLNIKMGDPVLHATRVTYDADNRPIEVAVSVTRGDRFSYKIRLAGRNKQI